MDEHGETNLVAQRFGQRLRIWRTKRKVPLKHLAAELGVSIQIVSDWERGRRFPTAKHLTRLETHMDVPLCGFFHAASDGGGGAVACGRCSFL